MNESPPDATSSSFDVRFRGIRKYKGKRRTTYTVRWTVAGKDFQETFTTAKLAEGHRSDLLRAARGGDPFDRINGLPRSMEPSGESITWMEHCIDFMTMKWAEAAPKYRKSLAESLTTITLNFLIPSRQEPDKSLLRSALFGWAFKNRKMDEVPDDVAETLVWLNAHSRPLRDLTDPANLRDVLHAMSTTQDGRRASNATIARRRSALHNCLDYAVERRHMASNPLKDVKRKRLPPAPAIDRRRVANPNQVRALLEAVHDHKPDLRAFFAILYYAGLRPSEALNLKRPDCLLPDEGWGRLLLSSSYQRAGAGWTDSGQVGEVRSLKHRADQDTRPVPAHPTLVSILREHISTYDLGPDGRLFVARTGRAGKAVKPPYDRPISMSTISRTWHRARAAALTAEEIESPLARRPYDLRHACLSTWLNAGVPPVQVAEWAGHSVQVLLSVYAKCIDGQEALALQRIETALGDDVGAPSTKTSPAIPPKHP